MLLALTGCAVYEGHKLPVVEPLAPSAGAEEIKPTASVTTRANHKFFSKSLYPPDNRLTLQAEFIELLAETGGFADVRAGKGGDVHFDVELLSDENPAAIIPAFITGWTFFIVPSWATVKVTGSVTASTHPDRKYDAEDEVTCVAWLPMAFVYFTQDQAEIGLNFRQNLWRNILLQMRDDGVLR